MCVTINASTANFIAKNLIVDRDNIYDQNITDTATNALPEFATWLAKTKTSLTNVSESFHSYDGTEFFQFAKSVSWGEDI